MNLHPNIPKQWKPFPIDTCVQLADPIPGWMTTGERKWLAETASALTGKQPVWVEIGVNVGKSMLCVIAALPPGSVFIGIDTWNGAYNRENVSYFDTYQTAIELRPDIRILSYRMDSVQSLEWIPFDSADVVFIDADHSYEATLRDIRSWLTKIKANGRLCGHDYIPEHPGVVQAVDTAASQFGMTIERHSFSIWELTNRTVPPFTALPAAQTAPSTSG